MGVSHEFHRVAVEKIIVPENRQREGVHKVEELADSIKRNGLFHPIILRRDHQLVAGACRLAAYKHLASEDPNSPKWKLIPAQYADELTPAQLMVIELEENIRRTDLSWQEQVLAALAYIEARGEGYTIQRAAVDLGLSERILQRWVRVAHALRSGDSKITACETLGAADNFIQRKAARAIDEGMMSIMGVDKPPVPKMAELDLELDMDVDTPPDDIEPVAHPPAQSARVASPTYARPSEPTPHVEESVQIADFLNMAPRYDGPPFNLIHCDFPYGIGIDKSEQGKAASRGAYEDSDDTFWRLVDCLIDNKDRLIAQSAHIMFWFHMSNYERLRQTFTRQGWFVNPIPLVWYKIDNIGIVPDPRRRPRQVYETALLVTVGDRPLVRAYPNCVAERSGKRTAHHISQKAARMLYEHFRGLVDESTTLLDPTCGSGTSLGAGILLGAKSVLGWEVNPEYAQIASSHVFQCRLVKFRGGIDKIDEGEEFTVEEEAALARVAELSGDHPLPERGPTDAELDEIEAEGADALDTDTISIDDLELEL